MNCLNLPTVEDKNVSYFCDYCQKSMDINEIYLDKHMNDGHGNAFVYCDYCDSQIGMVYVG